jgi:hypothetical protein
VGRELALVAGFLEGSQENGFLLLGLRPFKVLFGERYELVLFILGPGAEELVVVAADSR